MRLAIRTWLGVLALAAAVVPAARAQQLTGAGATFPYPIYSKWFDVYHEKTGVAISVSSCPRRTGWPYRQRPPRWPFLWSWPVASRSD